MSLDGVMQAPGGPEEDTSGGFKYGGWIVPFFDESLGEIMDKQMSKNSDLLLGRKTFEIFAAYWPAHESDWPGINEAKKYVVSNTISGHKWKNSIILNGKVEDQIKKLKQQDGADLQVYGSSNLIQTLLKRDLIDEFWLKIFPIILGNGKRLFGEGSLPTKFRLIENSVTPNGVIIANYAREGKFKTGSFTD